MDILARVKDRGLRCAVCDRIKPRDDNAFKIACGHAFTTRRDGTSPPPRSLRFLSSILTSSCGSILLASATCISVPCGSGELTMACSN